MIERALLSVSDKRGIVELAQGLRELGVELISTGGTARVLREAGLDVCTVEDVTAFPEILDGRVKTLHPAIHAAILARRQPQHLAQLAAQGITPIDLVVVNLYPFAATVAQPETTLAQAVEQIDIGGVALLRAAAKNFAHVTVVVDPADYAGLLAELRQKGDTSLETRQRLALKAFAHTAAYDAAISRYLSQQWEEGFPTALPLVLEKALDLRYGENPHQRAALYRLPGQVGVADAIQLHGKDLSLTNLLDLDAAWTAANDFAAPTAAIIKHTNPCGLASAPTLVQAYHDALASDPASAFGSVVGLNRRLDLETAQAINEVFTEAVIAPGFEPQALELLKGRRDRRLLELSAAFPALEMRGLSGGLLIQERDEADFALWRVVTQRGPTEAEDEALRFAWRAVKHVKSNAIVLARGTRTVGVGAGQMSRVDAVRLAVAKAGERAQGAVLASDAFFPFPDGVEEAARAGVTAIVQPGGSIRDEQAIAVADEHNVAMVFTEMRHFRH
ncbi:MAG: bifunctional phosphoribosylaminoimidazolecarboxamide formyltransferase/IMP cyclohydrolase [Anaerolineae bacterium]